MRTIRIFVNTALKQGETVTLDPKARQHLIKVLRLEVGEVLVVFNGEGGEYQAVLKSTEPEVTVEVGAFSNIDRAAARPIELGYALARGDKMDFVIQKAVELGASHISPLITSRSQVKLSGERLEKRMRHWQGVIASAMEQCGLNRLPLLNRPQLLEKWLASVGTDTRFVLDPLASEPLVQCAQKTLRDSASVALLIGPEGGLSKQEIEAAIASGFIQVSLGPRVLRTETAAVVSLAHLADLAH